LSMGSVSPSAGSTNSPSMKFRSVDVAVAMVWPTLPPGLPPPGSESDV
jgi:hypothetical protein